MKPVLPNRAVQVEPLGGEVVVRGLKLRERLDLVAAAREQGEAGFGHIAKLLAVCVLAEDGEPVFSADEWEVFGASHMAEVLDLFSVCQELSGMDVEASKKS